MPDGSPPPDAAGQWPKIEEAFRGVGAFGVFNFVMNIFINGAVGAPPGRAVIGALMVLVGVSTLAGWMDRGLGRRAFAAGLLGGYALMTVSSGGACTLFVQPPLLTTFNAVSGAFLYAVAIAVFGLVILNHRLSDSE